MHTPIQTELVKDAIQPAHQIVDVLDGAGGHTATHVVDGVQGVGA